MLYLGHNTYCTCSTTLEMVSFHDVIRCRTRGDYDLVKRYDELFQRRRTQKSSAIAARVSESPR